MDVYERCAAHLLCHIYIELSCQYNSDDEDKYNNEDAEDPNFPIDCFADAEQRPRCLS
jgi:hypothetical protein